MSLRILLLWASRSGNTENVAQRLSEVLAQADFDVENRPVKGFDWTSLSDYSVLLWGSPTYGSGDLHADWDQPERALRDRDLSPFAAAAFGCGSQRYPTAFWAVDILTNRLKNGGARLLLPSLKMETQAGLRVRDVDPWAEQLAEALTDFKPTGPESWPGKS